VHFDLQAGGFAALSHTMFPSQALAVRKTQAPAPSQIFGVSAALLQLVPQSLP
jgi:hypothetical protein